MTEFWADFLEDFSTVCAVVGVGYLGIWALLKFGGRE